MIMLLAVIVTLLAPVNLAPARAGGGESIMTLNVCETAGGGTVASGHIVYIPQETLHFTQPFCHVLSPGEDGIAIFPVFSSGPDRPPRA